MTKSPALIAAERYVELVNDQRFDQVGSLFADDAVVLSPTGEVVSGKVAITALWADEFSKSGPSSVTITSAVSDNSVCVVELSPQLPGESAPRSGHVVDHFTVDPAGAIVRLAIYLRPFST